MIKKRIIGSIIIKDGIAVQSIAFKNYQPLGRAKYLIENLNNWEVDEIFINCIDRSLNNLGPNFKLLKHIGELNIATPIIYCGGIRNKEDAINIIRLGADRISIENLIYTNPNEVIQISKSLGSQSIIGSIPVSLVNKKLFYLDYKTKERKILDDEILTLFKKKYISELLIIDWKNEGKVNAFNRKLLNNEIKDIPKIVFGGITNTAQIKFFLKINNVNGIVIGNSLNYKENSVYSIRNNI